MRIRPKILKMEFEIKAASTAWVTSEQEEFGNLMPIEPVKVVYAIIKATAVTDAATHEQAVGELCAGLSVNLTGFGLVHRAANGNDWLNLLRSLYGIKSYSYRGAQANDAWGVMPVPIPFAYPLDNSRMGAPGRPKGSWTAWTKMGTSSELDGLHLAYVADIIKDGNPSEVLCSDYLSFTAQAAEGDQVLFTKPGKLIGLMLFDTTPYDTTNITLLAAGKSLDFDTYCDAEAARKALEKFGGDWAGGDAADADCGAESYTFISFGKDPQNWPDITGKEVTFRAKCATAEAKRLYVVTARPVQ